MAVNRTLLFIQKITPAENIKVVSLLLRIAVAFVFLYPPVSAFFHPDAWLWFVPQFVEIILPREVFLHVFGVIEVVIGLGVLFLRDPRLPALAALAVLAAIVALDWSALDVTFRDISVLLAALALIMLHTPSKSNMI